MRIPVEISAVTAIMFLLVSCGKDVPAGNGGTLSGNGDVPAGELPYVDITLRSTGERLTFFNAEYRSYEEVLVVRSNVDWQVSSAEDWLRVEKGTGVAATLVIGVNTDGSAREGKLSFFTEKDGILAEITVRQDYTDKIGKDDFMDMMLIMSECDALKYKGYLMYDKEDRVQWLFDAFVFSISRYKGTSTHLVDMNRETMLDIIDGYFADGCYVSLLDAVAGELRDSIPGKFIPRKVVIGIPSIQSDDWGEIDGVTMVPSEDENVLFRTDKVRIAQWYVDEVVRQFAEKDYENVRLIGFYWQEENGNILPSYGMQIAGHIHSYGLGFYWIPYFDAYNWNNWADYGYDMAWLQPNYMFNDVSRDRLYDAYENASSVRMGLEMEWDNTCPLEKHIGYWDIFEETGVLSGWPIAYYESGSMFSYRDNITMPEWKAFYERAAEDIADRQKNYYGY